MPQDKVETESEDNKTKSENNSHTPPDNSPHKPDDVSSQPVRHFKSIKISGKIPVDQWTQLFSSFIVPLNQNNLEIEVSFKASSTLELLIKCR